MMRPFLIILALARVNRVVMLAPANWTDAGISCNQSEV